MSEKVGALVVAAAVVAMMLLLFLHSDVAEAKTYVVGKTETNNWAITESPPYYPQGIKLKTGDILEFKYNNAVHNVVRVGVQGYTNCNGSRGSKPFTSGDDKIALKKGWSYFICTNRDHCSKYNMKIAVNAA